MIGKPLIIKALLHLKIPSKTPYPTSRKANHPRRRKAHPTSRMVKIVIENELTRT